MSPTEKIVDKLKKLHNMAEGAKAIGNEAEAQAFAQAFQRMLTQHKLEMNDIDFSNLEKEEPVGNHYINFANHPEFEVKKSCIQWQSILAQTVADAHYCQIVRFAGSNKFYLVGRKSDAEVAEYTVITLIRAAGDIATREYGAYYRQCQARYGTPKMARGYRDAFLLGFINRLKERYDLMRNGDGKELALVRIARERQAVENFMNDQRKAGETKSMQSRKTWSMNEAGRQRGRAVADSVDLGGKAIRNGSTKGQLV